MTGILKGLGLGIIAFLIWMVLTAPARLIIPLIPPQLHLADIHGTLWSGGAGGLRFGAFTLNDVQWRLAALPLLVGRLQAHTVAREDEFRFDGTLAYGNGRIRVRDATVSTEASILNALWGHSELALTGPMTVRIESLDLSRRGPAGAGGSLEIREARLTAPQQADLGTVEGTITQEADTIAISIKNRDAPLGLGGKIILQPDWTYASELKLSPTPKTNTQLKDSLKLLGRTDRRGAVTLRGSGRLPAAGL